MTFVALDADPVCVALQDIVQLVQNAADEEDDDDEEEEEESPSKPSLARGRRKGGKAAAVCSLHSANDYSVLHDTSISMLCIQRHCAAVCYLTVTSAHEKMMHKMALWPCTLRNMRHCTVSQFFLHFAMRCQYFYLFSGLIWHTCKYLLTAVLSVRSLADGLSVAERWG